MSAEGQALERTPLGMFDQLRMSTEQNTMSPGLRKHGIQTFGEGQIDLGGMRGSNQENLLSGETRNSKIRSRSREEDK